jgi:hypothetical protein
MTDVEDLVRWLAFLPFVLIYGLAMFEFLLAALLGSGSCC